jgi:hypothetical protein
VRKALCFRRLALQSETRIHLRGYRTPHHLYRDMDLIGSIPMATVVNCFVDVAHSTRVDELDDFESVPEKNAWIQSFIIRNLGTGANDILVRAIIACGEERNAFDLGGYGVIEFVSGAIFARIADSRKDGIVTISLNSHSSAPRTHGSEMLAAFRDACQLMRGRFALVPLSIFVVRGLRRHRQYARSKDRGQCPQAEVS